jgi:tetratricopeptide (TPR) repeat protein
MDRAAKIREELGDPAAANALPKAFLGVGQIFSGQLREGTKEAHEALDVIAKDATADAVSTGMLFNFLAMGYARLGEFDAAERALAQSVGLGARGDDISRLDVNIARAGLELERGDVAQGVTRASQCAEQAETLGAVACAVAANINLGSGRLYQEDVLGAKPPVERGLELASMTNMVPMRTVAQALAGSVRARLGDALAGLSGWSEALATARGMSDKYGEAVTLWNRGRTYARQAQPDYAASIADLDEAARQFEAMEARPALARVLRDRATVLRALERSGEADEAERRSRDLARELGLRDFADAA